MPLRYEIPHASGELRQGEILRNIVEHRPQLPPVASAQGASIPIASIGHALMIVLTADCDLFQDFKARFAGDQPQEQYPAEELEGLPASLPHVLLCDLYEKAQIRGRIAGSEIWRRAKQNQDERYHRLASADVGDAAIRTLPDLYLDFKKALTLPTESLYGGIRNQGIERLAVVPPIYLQDLTHRFYSFLSRVGTPD